MKWQTQPQALYHVRYAQEARAYGLMAFMTLLSFYFFVKLLKGGSSRYTSAGYVISTALLMYTHFYGVFSSRPKSSTCWSLKGWKVSKVLLTG